MDREEIIRRFETLNVWRRDGKRAPHKPLLVLYAIGRMRRDGIRLIPYSEIEEDLKRLLQLFAPTQSDKRPHYPFWRLRKNKVWDVTHTDKIRETKSGDAFIRDLRRYNVSGGFTEDIFHEFQSDSWLALEIIQRLLIGHFPRTMYEDILLEAGLESPFQVTGIGFPIQIPTKRRRDPNFRLNILKVYEYKCAVCGFGVKLGDNLVALEAAHIKWHQAEGPNVPANGLALCSLHHRLFDRGAFTLSHQFKILVSSEAHGSVGFEEWLLRFHDRDITFPKKRSHYPRKKFINWHARQVFQGNPREF